MIDDLITEILAVHNIVIYTYEDINLKCYSSDVTGVLNLINYALFQIPSVRRCL